MVSLFIILVVVGFICWQFKKSTLVGSFATVIVSICAMVVAFSYFEILANLLIARKMAIPWAQPLCFILIFVLVFAILATVVAQLTKEPIDLGLWPERIGRGICGFFLGLIVCGVLMTALAMAPIPSGFPYQRFSKDNPDIENPSKPFINADGFATGLFGYFSNGCFSGSHSFAVLHPDFITSSFMNRYAVSEDVSLATISPVIEVPPKKAARLITEPLKNAQNQNEIIDPKSAHRLASVSVRFKKNAGTFTLSQFRLICKHQNDLTDIFAGKGKSLYPIGFIKAAGLLDRKSLTEPIKLTEIETEKEWLEFIFEVPADYSPVLIEFKQNNIAQVSL